MLPLAITGGIAEGKSTILEVLRMGGLLVSSADEIVAEIWRDESQIAELAERLDLSGAITKDVVRSVMGVQPKARRLVNEFFHQKVLAAMRLSRADAIEVPLLIETCLQTEFERVWVVTCGPDLQLQRVRARPDAASAERLLNAQLPTQVKIPFADEVIRTIGTMADVHTATLRALDRHRRR